MVMCRLVTVVVILTGVYIQDTEQLDCFNCTGIDTISACHNTSTCSSQQGCPMKIHHMWGDGTPVGRRVPSNTSQQCFQCCDQDGCNKRLCRPSAAGSGCHDDLAYNCAAIQQIFNVCKDVHHAKLVCRSFCNLCDLVDGYWSDWSTWSGCSVTCAAGQRSRVRSCTNPAPAHGGSPCTGSAVETQACTAGRQCPVDGGWSAWYPWQPCSVTCGTGMIIRARNCSNPSPSLFGQHCFGDAHQYDLCKTAACSVDTAWTTWSQWSACSVTCQAGSRTKSRVCSGQSSTGGVAGCHGNTTETETCQRGSCPLNGHWSTWRAWSGCGATCGTGMATRGRNCDNPAPSSLGRACFGDSTQYRLCHNHPCGVAQTGTWASWEPWSPCDVTCGYGSRNRSRSCVPSGVGNCLGQSYQQAQCRAHPCQIDGQWTVWGSWSGCPSTYVIERIRIRLCIGPYYGGTKCAGANSETTTSSCP